MWWSTFSDIVTERRLSRFVVLVMKEGEGAEMRGWRVSLIVNTRELKVGRASGVSMIFIEGLVVRTVVRLRAGLF